MGGFVTQFWCGDTDLQVYMGNLQCNTVLKWLNFMCTSDIYIYRV